MVSEPYFVGMLEQWLRENVAISSGVEDQVIGDAREKGVGEKHDKSRDVMVSLEVRLAWVELAMVDDCDRIGELAKSN